MKLFILTLSVLSLTGCGTAGYVAGRIARIPVDIVTYDEHGAEQPTEFEQGELGGL